MKDTFRTLPKNEVIFLYPKVCVKVFFVIFRDSLVRKSGWGNDRRLENFL